MDSATAPVINVRRRNGTVMSFKDHPSALYVFKCNVSNESNAAFTIDGSSPMTLFSRREIESADHARDFYRKIGRPTRQSSKYS
jgi:hypothetical protein